MLPPISALKPASVGTVVQRAATEATHAGEPAALQIGILGRHDDPSVHNIAAAVQARGGVAHLIDLSDVTHSGNSLQHKGGAMPKLDVAIAYHGAELPHDGMKHMRMMEGQGTPFVNTPDSIQYSRDKWLSGDVMQWAGVRTPRTELARSGDEARKILPTLGDGTDDIITKIRVGTEGNGVMKLERKAVPPVVDALEALKRDVNSHGVEVVEPGTVVQGLVKMDRPADIRTWVVDGKLVQEADGRSASMQRVVGESKDGDFRTNLSNGGTAEPYELHPRDRETAERAAHALGLDIAGVDLMGERGAMYVIEANSGPGQKIKGITGVPVDDHIAKLAMSRAAEARAAAGQVQ